MSVRRRKRRSTRNDQSMSYRDRWNPASPSSSTRACYCKDENTYSRECCDGSLWSQGIGRV